MFVPASSPPRFATLVFLTGLATLAQNMFVPSLAHIAEDLNTSYALASLSVSGFLLVNGALLLIMGPVADRFGRRPVLLVSLAVFAASSVVCALAQNIETFLAARTAQSLVVAGSTLSAAIISDTRRRDEAASLMGYLAMAMAVAPMLAPMLGGVMDTLLGWRSVFWLFALGGLAALCWVWLDLGETNPAPADTLFAQIRTYPELLGSRRFWGYTICIACGIGSFFLFISATPLVGQAVFGLSTSAIGVGIGAMTGGFFVGSFLSGRYAARMGGLWMILAGRSAAVLGLGLALCLFALGLGHPLIYIAGAVSSGFGNGLSIPSARAGALAVRPHIAGSAAGLSGALFMFVGAGLTLLPGLLLTPENGAWLTLTLMLAVALCALAAGLYVKKIERLEAAMA